MHVAFAALKDRSRERIEAGSSNFSRVSKVSFVGDLAAAYDFAEHESPDLYVVGTDLVRRPEFKALLGLLKALSIECVILLDEAENDEKIRLLCRDLNLACVRFDDLAELFQSHTQISVPGKGPRKKISVSDESPRFDDGVILLGASTGGVDALLQLLATFPKNCPGTVIVQHSGSGFSSGLVKLLDSHVLPDVIGADPLVPVQPGRVVLAPNGHRHLHIKRGTTLRVALEKSRMPHAHCPSIDELFLSAVPLAERVSAAVLTGMGRDGAKGLLALRQAGARTFVQDEASSVVYGMPKAAYEMGGGEKILPLGQLGPALLASRQRSV